MTAGDLRTVLRTTQVKTAAYTAHPGDFVLADTTTASVTITLPLNPPQNTVVGVKQVATAAGHAASVAAAGADSFNLPGGSTVLMLSLLAQGVMLQYSSGVWVVQSDDLPLAQLDARYAPAASATQGPQSAGYAAWTGDRWQAARAPASAVSVLTTYPAGSITLTRMNIPSGVTCAGNLDILWNAGTGTAGLNGYVAVFNSAGAQQGSVSPDLAAHAAGFVTVATGQTSWPAGNYYIAYVIGTQSGTLGAGPAIFNGDALTLSSAAPGDSQPFRASHQTGGGLTAMPSSLTLGSGWTAWLGYMIAMLR